MTNEEKKFLVKKKVSYEKQIDEKTKCMILQTLTIGFTLAGISLINKGGYVTDIDICNKLIESAQYFVLTSCGSCLINNIFDNIRLKDRIEDIDTEIELDKVRSMQR